MTWFPVPVFPEGALSASVIVTVWVGITVVAFTNLRLGWVLSGLVVPGYLVPLLIVKPVSALVVLAEGVVTYSIVWLYSEYSTRFTGMSSFFGRDRFFALVLVSVAVRIVNDGFLLPALGEWLLQNHDYAFDYRSNLHSFGLIIVALIANNFWKPGLRRGAWPMAVQLGLTWLIVRYGLMEFTNFNMNSLAFMYEDSASSFLAAPKAYIVLLVTAFIASRLNLFYGWDFSGILIPSLLALQWFEPYKILTTFVEAAVILVIADAALRLPMFRNITMEGGRKLLLFFNVSFLYKYLLSWGLILFMPHVKVSDWFGFGYLLATLIALKIHDKGILARMTRATLQASVMGAVAATLIGFILVLLPDPGWEATASDKVAIKRSMAQDKRAIADVLAAAKTDYYASFVQPMKVPMQRELDAFATGVRRLLEYDRSGDPQALEAARSALWVAHYDVERVEENYLVLRERQPVHHWGTYVLRLQSRSRLLVSVPAPADEPGAFEAATTLLTKFDARAFAASGASRFANPDGTADAVVRPQTIFQAFHHEMAMRNVLQVRSRDAGPPVLYVSGSVPEEVELKFIEDSAKSLRVEFVAGPERSIQRSETRGNFAELWTGRDSATRLWAAGGEAGGTRPEIHGQPAASLLRDLVTPEHVAASASNAYRPLHQDELLRVDREILTPLLSLSTSLGKQSASDRDLAARISLAAKSARAVGMELRWISAAQGSRGGDYFLLSDTSRAGGRVLIRAGAAANYVIEVPRPLVEGGTLETAIVAFDDLQARVLVVAGSAPDANEDGSADVLAMNNTANLYTLAHQLALREMGDLPGAAMQVRAFGVRPGQPPPRQDALLSLDSGMTDRQALSGTSLDLLKGLEHMGLNIRLGGGDRESAGYDAAGGPQARYMKLTRNKDFAVLWVSPLVRRQLDDESMRGERSLFIALGMPVTKTCVIAELTKRRMSRLHLPATLRNGLEQYLETRDIVLLSNLQRRVSGTRFERIEDSEGRGAYLLMSDRDGQLLAAVSLAARSRDKDSHVVAAQGKMTEEDAIRFVSERSRWLVVQ